MATLLPSLSSDEENDNFDSEDEVEDSNEVNRDFSFGGVLVRVLVDRTICLVWPCCRESLIFLCHLW